jgi:hypothetical protein
MCVMYAEIHESTDFTGNNSTIDTPGKHEMDVVAA